MTTAFAEARGLTIRHIGRREPAFRDLSLHWEDGERLLLLGPSGSGKSTFALTLDGVIPHAFDAHWEAGSLEVAGEETRTAGIALLARTVGVLFQDPETQLILSRIDDEIAFGLENLAIPRPELLRRIAAARAKLGLTGDRVPERIAALSGGAKQRLALASILAQAPRGLVFDEPTANLDPRGAQEVADAIAALCADRARSLLLIEHRLDGVLGLVDRVAVLDERGSLERIGTVDAVFGTDERRLDALGVWVPELTRLARLLGSGAVPRSARDAATLIATAWPAGRRPMPREARTGGELLALREVSFRYPGAAQDALAECSLAIGAGELVAIVGANGAGKSTAGLLLAGALRPATGSVRFDGRELRAWGERAVRARLGYVFQYPEHQLTGRTVRGEIVASLRARGVAAGAVAARTAAALDEAGLGALGAASPHTLSHGQKRRLSVATATVSDPEVLILDEPTFGQDRRHTDALLERLAARHRAGHTIVVITHDLSLVADHATRVIAMAEGRVAYAGSVAGLLADDDLLARTGLVRPPVAEAFRLAHELRADVPLLTGLADVAAALAG